MKSILRSLGVLLGLLPSLFVAMYGWAHIDKAELIRHVTLKYYAAPDVRVFKSSFSMLEDFLRVETLRTQGMMWMVAACVLGAFVVTRALRHAREKRPTFSPWLTESLQHLGAPVVHSGVALLFCSVLSCASFRDAELIAETARQAGDRTQLLLAKAAEGTGGDGLAEQLDGVRKSVAQQRYYENRSAQSLRGACIWSVLGIFWLFVGIIAIWRYAIASGTATAPGYAATRKRPFSPYIQVGLGFPCILFGCQRLQSVIRVIMNRGCESEDLSNLLLGSFLLLVALLVAFVHRSGSTLQPAMT